ncbi:MAG: ABC transporter permease [Myxococcota bacterium]
MRIRRAFSIAEKEAMHILRDPFTLGIALLLPFMMVMCFGLCIEFNVKNIPIAVYDADHTVASQKFVEIMGSSGYFVPEYAQGQKGAVSLIDGNKARAALIIPFNFQKDLIAHHRADAQVLLDGSDSSTVGLISGYLNAMSLVAAEKIAKISPPQGVQIKTRYLYNAELNSRWFSIPGLLVIILAMLSILLTALTVAREWENGSMELLLSTPAKPIEIILGKLAPYLVLGLGAVGLVYWLARVVFNIPFRGSHWVFLLGCGLFLIGSLAQGLLISVVTRKQQLAMQLSMQTGFMPSLLLSGFIFPIESMPQFFQYFTMIFPARWFMEISRSSFLEGAGLIDLQVPFIALAIQALILVTLASRKFKTDLEP